MQPHSSVAEAVVVDLPHSLHALLPTHCPFKTEMQCDVRAFMAVPGCILPSPQPFTSMVLLYYFPFVTKRSPSHYSNPLSLPSSCISISFHRWQVFLAFANALHPHRPPSCRLAAAPLKRLFLFCLPNHPKSLFVIG